MLVKIWPWYFIETHTILIISFNHPVLCHWTACTMWKHFRTPYEVQLSIYW